ncbi:MAG TPA: hypothetical protein VK631_13905, partial [Solirubrobacteraceae bacterium]|nr:hypothetical protein [Solirubrobacteraceae bacterium]
DAASVFVGGSAQSANDVRAGVAVRWSAARGGFDWLERVDAAPGAADGFTAIVPAGAFVYGVGSANGSLAVAKLDADTGRLRQACGPSGVRLSSLGPAVLPGRAVAAGGTIVVVGRTLAAPTRGFIAAVDGGGCNVVRSALVGAGDPSVSVGFTGVDLDASGNPVVAGFSGTSAALFRFDGGLNPRGTQRFDLGGAFSDVRAGPDGGVAVGAAGSRLLAQCFTLPALSADGRCGTAGRRSLRFHRDGVPASGATLGRLPSGSWLVAGSHTGEGGFATRQSRPALSALEPDGLGADARVFGPTGRQVFDPFPTVPAGFSAVTASAASIAGVGSSGQPGSTRPFLFSSGLDGTRPVFTPLTGLDAAPPAAVEPAPPAQPAQPPPPATTGAAPLAPRRAPALATARFARLARRPAADGTFGFVALTCRRACTARGRYTTPGPGTRAVRLGGTKARLAARWRLRLRLAFTRRGLRTLARAERLPVTVRFVVTDGAGARQVVRRQLVVRARAGS